jgi:alpha-L-arabinofuranosidase
MKPRHLIRLSATLLALLAWLVVPQAQAPAPAAPAASVVKATLRADQPGAVVNRNIYGHFAEHLGHGIYEGIWVGPDSPIPNTRGIRNDVLAALKELKLPVLPTGNWRAKGSATAFGEDQWFSTLSRTLQMDDLITRHAAIMDKTDAAKRVGLVVDEWGTWYDVEPGSLELRLPPKSVAIVELR